VVQCHHHNSDAWRTEEPSLHQSPPADFAIPGQVLSSGNADEDEDKHVEITTSRVAKTSSTGTLVQTHQKTEIVKNNKATGDMMGAVLDWVLQDITRTGLLVLVVALVLYNLISFLRGGSPLPRPHLLVAIS
jgi:hypothetical protein